MNNKKYILLLSAFIACTSMGMENTEISSSKLKVLSLVEIAAKAVADNVDLAVRNDVQLLKENDQLTEDNVRKNIENEIASLSLCDDLSDDVWQAYRRLHTYPEGHEEWVPVEHGDNPWLFRMNGYKDKIAVLIYKNNSYEKMELLLYTALETGWKNEQLGEINNWHTYTACWGKDNELILLNEKAIHILPTPNKEGFDRRYTLPYESERDCFYRYHKDLKILAIEQRLHPGTEDKSANVALLHIQDNALRIKHIIPCGKPISSIFMGIHSLYEDDGEIVQVWSEGGKRFAQWKEVEEGVYRFLREHFNQDRSCDGAGRMFMGELYVEHNSEILYAGSCLNNITIKRELIPIYEIPKKIIYSKKIIHSLEDTKQ